MKYWEIIADNLKKAGFILDWVSGLDLEGRTIWIVDAHGYGKRFIVRAGEKLTAFVELERAIHQFAVRLSLNGCASDKGQLQAKFGRRLISPRRPARNTPVERNNIDRRRRMLVREIRHPAPASEEERFHETKLAAVKRAIPISLPRIKKSDARCYTCVALI